MREIEVARNELAQAMGILRLVMGRLEHPLKEGVQAPAPPPLTSLAEHRRQHRPGVPSKLDTDEDLRAFVLERIDQMGYVELAAEVASHFPPDRRVGKSVLQKWHRKLLPT